MIVLNTKAYTSTDSVKHVNTIDPNGGKLLKAVNIKDRKNSGTANATWMSKASIHSANLHGPGHADLIFDTKDLENCVDFLSCLMNKIPFTTHSGDSYYFQRNVAAAIGAPVPIAFMLDGVILNNTTPIETLSAENVASVEVLKNNGLLAIYGSQASGGLVIITTKVGTEGEDNATAYKSVPGVIYKRFNGYYKSKEFYSPKYNATDIRKADSRTAIFWNPNITTDANGLSDISFYNSDLKGTYRAVIEGIDNAGNIGRYVYRYQVK